MIDFQNNEACCGCSACAAVCSKKCIVMTRNQEGFYRPMLLSADKCVNCGLCNKTA